MKFGSSKTLVIIVFSTQYLNSALWIILSNFGHCMSSLLKLEITYDMFGFHCQFIQGSLKRIDYPKQICLANPLSFECFHCS